jgi:hypothetical protein
MRRARTCFQWLLRALFACGHLLGAAAGEYAPPERAAALEAVKALVAEAAKSERKVALWLDWFGAREKAELAKADAKCISVKIHGNVFDQPWEKLSPEQIAAAAKDCVRGDAPRAVTVADYCLALGLARRADELLNLAAQCQPAPGAELAERWGYLEKLAKAASPPPPGNEANGSGGAGPAVKVPPGAFRDRIIGRDGRIDRGQYVAYAMSADQETIAHRLGPDYAFYHKNEKDEAPEVHLRHADGEYIHKEKGKNAVDWTGMGGQVLYVPQSAKDPGVDRMEFCWSFHQNHGGGQFWHCYQLKPTCNPKEQWWTGSPDPGVKQRPWIEAAGGAEQLKHPVAVARGKVSWSNCGIMVFRSGVIGATGYGNNDDKYPFTKLPPGKIPMAVAVTPNNEFALVAVWDMEKVKGQVAVVALEARALAQHSWHYSGMPSVGTYTRLKILGFVDLPGMVAPSGIAAAGNVARFKWTTDVSKERLDSQETRDKWFRGADENHQNCTGGYAVVISRAESKAVFVDLAPLFQYFRKMCFTTAEEFKKTQNEGPAPDQWPFTFDVAKEAAPKVVQTVDVPQPTAVATGFVTGDDRAFGSKAFITTLEGSLLLYDVGALMSPKATTGVEAVGALPIGRNPTCIATGRHLWPKNQLVIACRGEKEVVWVSVSGKSASVQKRLRDQRLVDPVYVEASDTRGASVVSVADFKGQKVVSYLHKAIDSWGEKLFGGLGPDGKAEFECTGTLELPGMPFLLSCAEVN